MSHLKIRDDNVLLLPRSQWTRYIIRLIDTKDEGVFLATISASKAPIIQQALSETPGLKHEKLHVTILAHHLPEDPHEITAQNLLHILLIVAPLQQPRR